MNFLIFEDTKRGKPERTTIPIEFLEPESKPIKKPSKSMKEPAKEPAKEKEETSGVHAFIASNPNKKQVMEYFKSRIEELTV